MRWSFWHGQIVRTAESVGFFANVARDGSWWTCLYLNVLGEALRYLVFLQKVGRADLGVLAVTTFGEVIEDRSLRAESESSAADRQFRRTFESTPSDRATLVHQNTPEERWPDVRELIDRTLSASVGYFADQLA